MVVGNALREKFVSRPRKNSSYVIAKPIREPVVVTYRQLETSVIHTSGVHPSREIAAERRRICSYRVVLQDSRGVFIEHIRIDGELVSEKLGFKTYVIYVSSRPSKVSVNIARRIECRARLVSDDICISGNTICSVIEVLRGIVRTQHAVRSLELEEIYGSAKREEEVFLTHNPSCSHRREESPSMTGSEFRRAVGTGRNAQEVFSVERIVDTRCHRLEGCLPSVRTAWLGTTLGHAQADVYRELGEVSFLIARHSVGIAGILLVEQYGRHAVLSEGTRIVDLRTKGIVPSVRSGLVEVILRNTLRDLSIYLFRLHGKPIHLVRVHKVHILGKSEIISEEDLSLQALYHLLEIVFELGLSVQIISTSGLVTRLRKRGKR